MPSSRPIPVIHLAGEFLPGRVVCVPADPPPPLPAEVELAIAQAWNEALRRPGVHLFDGPMVRLRAWRVEAGVLRLWVGVTGYRHFLGTNLTDASLADRFGPDVLANPIGISTLLRTADGGLVLGMRSARVAYHPSRIHPIAGSLEPDDAGDVYAAAVREIEEETALPAERVMGRVCVGLVEDPAIRQPELVFAAETDATFDELSRRLDVEHDRLVRVEPTGDGLARAAEDPLLTPVAAGAVLLWGRRTLGEGWFAAAAAGRAVYIPAGRS